MKKKRPSGTNCPYMNLLFPQRKDNDPGVPASAHDNVAHIPTPLHHSCLTLIPEIARPQISTPIPCPSAYCQPCLMPGQLPSLGFSSRANIFFSKLWNPGLGWGTPRRLPSCRLFQRNRPACRWERSSLDTGRYATAHCLSTQPANVPKNAFLLTSQKWWWLLERSPLTLG